MYRPGFLPRLYNSTFRHFRIYNRNEVINNLHSNSVLKTLARPRRLPMVLTRDEQRLLLSVPNQKVPTGLRNYCLLRIFLNAGLRVSEALALKDTDIDFLSGRLEIRCGKGGRDRILWLKVEELKKMQLWLNLRPAESEHMFSTLKGGPMNDRYVRDFVKRYGKKGGIKKDVHPHLLRHTFATDLLNSTGNVRLVQKALGHATLATTMIYTHIVDEQLELAMKTFRE